MKTYDNDDFNYQAKGDTNKEDAKKGSLFDEIHSTPLPFKRFPLTIHGPADNNVKNWSAWHILESYLFRYSKIIAKKGGSLGKTGPIKPEKEEGHS